MTLQSVTLQLPEDILRRARQSARALQRPVEDVLAKMISAALPDMDGVPENTQAELLDMTWMDDQGLWEVARSAIPSKQQDQLRYLAELQTQRELTPSEQKNLEELRQEYGRYTLRKARAFALLSLRGGKPLLAEA